MKKLMLSIIVVALLGVAAAGTGERLAVVLQQRGFSPGLVVFLIAMLPVVELRGAVPVGILLLDMPWWQAVLWSVAGNIAPIVLVLLLLEQMVALLGRIRFMKRFFDWLFARARSKSASIQKYEFWGLATFVGIPLPGTGAWTGAVAAEVLGLSYWRALLSIFVGVLMAAAVVTFLSVLGKQFRWVGILLIVALVLGFAYAVFRGVRKARSRRTV